MSYKPKTVVTPFNAASTIKIINTIRANAPLSYQDSIPEIDQYEDIVSIGETILGAPGLQNTFVSILNRIGMVWAKSAFFYNKFGGLKKGFLRNGEMVEDIFVDYLTSIYYNPEKANGYEHKRFLPNVHSSFHVVNWEVFYPLTIQYEELSKAFLSGEEMNNFISTLFESMRSAYEYDEYLLFKYLLIKGFNYGKIKKITLDNDDYVKHAGIYRGYSNLLTFPSTQYNLEGVRNVTPREDQIIIMDSVYNGSFDAEALASAFNMDKRTFFGNLYLVDSFSTFDNDRFTNISEASTMIEDVTTDELSNMENVKAMIISRNWFQIYDKIFYMKERETTSGLYWTYFLHSWKVFDSSIYENAIAFSTES